MPITHRTRLDLVDVWREPGRQSFLRTLTWGDAVEVEDLSKDRVAVRFTSYTQAKDGSISPRTTRGFIEPPKSSRLAATDTLEPASESRVLSVHFVDVQQGDGSVIETPDGQVVLVDGGDNQLFARYLAAHYRGTTAASPRDVACLLVTHGDADHFSGLAEILASETHRTASKRLFMRPLRVFHNGLVKRPTSRAGKPVKETELLGPTRTSQRRLYLTGLVDDLLEVPESEMNTPFRVWTRSLATYHARHPIEFKRLSAGDAEAFRFLESSGLKIEVLGPLPHRVGNSPALPFLREPPAGPRVGPGALETSPAKAGSYSASHTINGHSVVFRLTYGEVSFLFAGDLNEEAARALTQAAADGKVNLQSDVFKVPHHGSGDFSAAFIRAVAPVLSVVSSGDESARKEYIHPRANLVGALGRWSRLEEPLVFVTELAAFFSMEGWSQLADPEAARKRGRFFGFSRAAFGLVRTRTDGRRLLVCTDSANVRLKEAYAFLAEPDGRRTPVPVVRA